MFFDNIIICKNRRTVPHPNRNNKYLMGTLKNGGIVEVLCPLHPSNSRTVH